MNAERIIEALSHDAANTFEKYRYSSIVIHIHPFGDRRKHRSI